MVNIKGIDYEIIERNGVRYAVSYKNFRHEWRIVTCPVCGEDATKLYKISEYKKNVPENLACPDCHDALRTMQSVLNSKKAKCDLCSKDYEFGSLIEVDDNKKKEVGNQVCHDCYIDKINPILIKQNERGLMCEVDEAKARAKRKEKREREFEELKKAMIESLTKCDLCGNKFAFHRLVEVVLNKDKNVNNHVCVYCYNKIV